MECIGIAGLGLLGRGISASLLAHGYRVAAYTPNPDEYLLAEAEIRLAIGELAEHAQYPSALIDEWPGRFIHVADLEAFADCSFVIESIVECLEAKRALYRRLESIVSAETPIATNTSSLPIGELQAECLHPERLVGMHWAEPAHATRFLEIVRGAATDDQTVAAAEKLARSVGKEPCAVSADLPGFIANRLAYAMYREAFHLLQSGVANAETIDRSFRNSVGLWAAVCGPLRWIDLTGGPSLYCHAMDNVLPGLCKEESSQKFIHGVVRENARGVIDGEGFYTYAPGDVAEWEQRFREHVWLIKSAQDREFPIATEK
jgi:3-hydroxybutyryl-CoA dehydrogenase